MSGAAALIDEWLALYAAAGWPVSRAAALVQVREALAAPEDAFEQWLVERTLREARSPEWRQSAEAEYLRAEWERNR